MTAIEADTYYEFLLTPLREGRPTHTKKPASHATFLLTPLREGRRSDLHTKERTESNFYSRPCGRGDRPYIIGASDDYPFLLTPLREGRLSVHGVTSFGSS